MNTDPAKPLRFFADLPNDAGYRFHLIDRAGNRTLAEIARESDRGCHFVTVEGKRILLANFYGWDCLPV